MRISVELVPRSEASLHKELTQIREHLPGVDTINIPDVLRFDLRSWQGCACAGQYGYATVPHIRAIDIDPKAPLPFAEHFAAHGIDEVLVVAGDPPADMSRKVYPTSSIDLIRKIRRELPHLSVYAALDPYRAGFTRERDYALQKLDAGAQGLFTQPFFDLRLMEIYAEILADVDMFWGVTTVTNERSQQYWQTRNRAIFPADFTPTLAWNRRFAKEALAFVRGRGSSLYFMPIRTPVLEYLEGIV